MTEIGREERQAILRVDARSVPFEDPVHDHRVAQIMNARPCFSSQWLQPRSAYDVREQPSDHFRCVMAIASLVPEQAGARVLRSTGTTPRIDIGAKLDYNAVG